MAKRGRKVTRTEDGAGPEEGGLERAVAGALRAAIHDHGPIDKAGIGSATKRVVGQLKNAQLPASAAAAALGRLGGRAGRGTSKKRAAGHYARISKAGGAAGRGAAKRRGGEAHYRELAASRWASMTPEERSEEMRRRRQKGLQRRKHDDEEGA